MRATHESVTKDPRVVTTKVRTVLGFVTRLARTQATGLSFNQYAGPSPASSRKRANLRRYLSAMLELGTDWLLVGEAPSYRGGRLTGIPFLSEKLMLEGVKGTSLFGAGPGFVRATRFPRLSTEASATMVWETIGCMVPPPLLWNAYPFHPFREGSESSNRAPHRIEIEIGQPFLLALVDLFEISQIIAVGNHASASMSDLGIAHHKVRHPANGGKKKFVQGIRRLCQNER